MLIFKQNYIAILLKLGILFFSLQLIGQTDSLARKSLDTLIKNYHKTIRTNPTIAKTYITAAYTIAVQQQDEFNQTRFLYGMAFSNTELGVYSTAIQNIETAIPLAEKLKNYRLLFKLYNLKGTNLLEIGNDFTALEMFQKSRDYAILNKNQVDIATATANIGIIKKRNKDYKQAVSILKEALQIFNNIKEDTHKNAYIMLGAYINIVDTYLYMRQFHDTNTDEYLQEAIHYMNLGFKICSKEKYSKYYYDLLLHKAIVMHEQEKYQESNQLLEEIYNYATKINYEASYNTVYFYKGKNYYELKEHQKAILSLEKLYKNIQIAEKEYINKLQLHGLLAWSYYEIGDMKKSKIHHEIHKKLNDEEQKRNVAIIETIHKKNDIPEHTKKVKLLETAYEQEAQKKRWLYGITIVLILLLIASIIFYKIKVQQIQKRADIVLQKVVELEQQQLQQKTNVQKTTASISEKVTDAKAALLLEKLTVFETKEEFLSLDCSLSFVAEKLKSNTSYVSNVINNYKNKTFKAYITELRINAALIRLKNDEKLRAYTIKAIAEEFGFKRQETFSKAFKSQTGIYPSQYLKKLRQDLEID